MSKETIEGITKIAVSGFKSLAEECTIDIRPLTILAGANSSGKSSIMQPLLMLKQTLEAPYDPGPLLIDGPNVQFTEAEQFLSKCLHLSTSRDSRNRTDLASGSIGEGRADRFQVQIEKCSFDFCYSVRTTFRKGPRGIEIVEMTKTKNKSQLLSTEDMTRYSFDKDITLYPEMTPEEIKSLADQGLIPKSLDVVRRSRCFLELASQDGHISFPGIHAIDSDIFNSIHLPGLRGNPERTYKPASTGPQYPGTFEHYSASIIHEWQETGDERLKTLADALHTLGLTGQVGTKKIGDTRIELQVGRLPLRGTGETGHGQHRGCGIRRLPSLARLSCPNCCEAGAVDLSRTTRAASPPPCTSRIGASVGRCGETWRLCRRGNAQLAATSGGSNACCRRKALAGVGEAALVHTG